MWTHDCDVLSQTVLLTRDLLDAFMQSSIKYFTFTGTKGHKKYDKPLYKRKVYGGLTRLGQNSSGLHRSLTSTPLKLYNELEH